MEVMQALQILSKCPEALNDFLHLLETELSFPNFPIHTEGGKVFWNTLAEYEGLRLQQNMVTHHCRILNKNDKRIAWGTKNGMIKALDSIYELRYKYQQLIND